MLAAGCAARPAPTPAPAPPPTPAVAPDGAWRGTSTRFLAGSRACPGPGLVHFDIVGGAFRFRWSHGVWVDAIVAADGSVSGQAGDVTLTGKQTGGRIEADAINPECGLHVTVTKQL